MRVLVVSSWCPYPADNGSRLRAFHLLRQLSRLGHVVTLIALTQEDNDLNMALTGLADICPGGISLFPSRFFRPGTVRALAGFLDSRPRVVMDTWQSDAAAEITHHCLNGGYDAIVAMELGAAPYIPEQLSTPVILDQVEVSGFLRTASGSAITVQKLRKSLTVVKLKHYLKTLSRRFSSWTVVSEEERIAVLKLLGNSRLRGGITVLPNGVDTVTNNYDNHFVYDPNCMIYNGSVNYDVNREAVEYFAANVLPLVHQDCPNAHLVVTGRSDSLQGDHDLLKNRHITFTGYLDDIRPAMRSAAVCVVPLLRGGGTRLKILEAMALGTPVVSSQRGASGLNVRDNHELCIADSPKMFAQSIRRLIDDLDFRKCIVLNANQLVKKQYDWDRIGENLSDQIVRLNDGRKKVTGQVITCH